MLNFCDFIQVFVFTTNHHLNKKNKLNSFIVFNKISLKNLANNYGFNFQLAYSYYWNLKPVRGWSGGAMVLGKLPVPGRPTVWITVGQGPTALAVGAGGSCLDIFTLIYPFSPLSPSLWETARYRLKYSLKGPLNPKQPTNQLKPVLSVFNTGTFIL